MKVYSLEVKPDRAPDKIDRWKLVGVYAREHDAVYDWNHVFAVDWDDYVIEEWDI